MYCIVSYRIVLMLLAPRTILLVSGIHFPTSTHRSSDQHAKEVTQHAVQKFSAKWSLVALEACIFQLSELILATVCYTVSVAKLANTS